MHTRKNLSIALISANAAAFLLLLNHWLDPLQLSQNFYFMREFLAIFINLYFIAGPALFLVWLIASLRRRKTPPRPLLRVLAPLSSVLVVLLWVWFANLWTTGSVALAKDIPLRETRGRHYAQIGDHWVRLTEQQHQKITTTDGYLLFSFEHSGILNYTKLLYLEDAETEVCYD